MRFVHGADFTARRVAAHIAARLGASSDDGTTIKDSSGSQAAAKIPVKPS
jgi:hypothetical protein